MRRLLNAFLIGTSRVKVALHGILLGTLPFVMHDLLGMESLLIADGAMRIRAFVTPALLLLALWTA